MVSHAEEIVTDEKGSKQEFRLKALQAICISFYSTLAQNEDFMSSKFALIEPVFQKLGILLAENMSENTSFKL